MKKIKAIARTVALVLVGLILGISIYSWNAKSLVGNSLPMPFGYGAAVVLSGSMEPELSVGDLIVVKQTDQVSVDDIVVYQSSGSLVVHRVIAVDGNMITTQGDANNTADEPVDISAVKGAVLFTLPNVGSAVSFLKSPVGIVCIIGAAIALIELPRRKEKQRDDEQRQKIIDEIIRLKNEQQ